jgi:hypothetical protein
MPYLPDLNPPKPLDPGARLLYATRLRKALEELMTDEERDYYECLFEHFNDFQNDLLIDLQKSVPPLDPSKLHD